MHICWNLELQQLNLYPIYVYQSESQIKNIFIKNIHIPPHNMNLSLPNKETFFIAQ